MSPSPAETTAEPAPLGPRRDAGAAQREVALRDLLFQGIAAARRGRRERAQRCFEAVLSEDPGNEEAWLGLARLTEDRNLARAMYDRALEFCPQSARVRAALRALDDAAASPPPAGAPATEAAWPPDPAPTVPPAVTLDAGAPLAASSAETAPRGAALYVPPWESGTPLPFGPRSADVAAVPSSAASEPPAEPAGDMNADASAAESEAAVAFEAEPLPAETAQPLPAETAQPLPAETPLTTTAASATTEDVSSTEVRRSALVEETSPAPSDILPAAPIQEKELATVAMPDDAQVPPTEGTPAPAPAAPAPVMPPAARPSPWRRSSRDAAMVLMLAFVLLGAVLMLILAGRDSRADAVRSVLGIATETPTATATLLPTETPTQLPTLTASPTLAAPAITTTVAITLTPVITSTAGLTPTGVFTNAAWVTARYVPLPLEEKWIEVNLTTQTLIAYEGTTVVFKTKISSGRKNTPTLEGKWRIREKLESQLMSGPGYYLPGVPYVMYFVGNYALHGAYWHNNWGTPMSHGCVNLKREDARWLYNWTGPTVPKGQRSVVSTAANPGTWVLVHK